jgi:serine protease Do
MAGEVVGVNTYTLAAGNNHENQGLYLARSCRTTAAMAAAIIRDGKVTRASLGVKMRFVGLGDSRAQDVPQGAVVAEVAPKSPAAEAGLHAGAMIVRIGDYDIQSVGDLNDALAMLKAGETVDVVFHDYQYTLGPPPKPDDLGAKLLRGVMSGLEKDAPTRAVKVVLK